MEDPNLDRRPARLGQCCPPVPAERQRKKNTAATMSNAARPASTGILSVFLRRISGERTSASELLTVSSAVGRSNELGGEAIEELELGSASPIDCFMICYELCCWFGATTTVSIDRFPEEKLTVWRKPQRGNLTALAGSLACLQRAFAELRTYA